jgi:para-nitrobenzyl esterase
MGERVLPAVLLVACLSTVACDRSKSEPRVIDPTSKRTIGAGEVVGFVGRHGSHVWLGIPYAKAPVGELRWRAPRPAPPWAGTREALSPGSPCMQYGSSFGGIDAEPGQPGGNEDCLYLNVYAPRLAPSEVPTAAARLPVMLWIHGGGNTIGEAGFYDGGNLATTHRVMVVTANYRLGPFGWFRHAALRAGQANEGDLSGNFGTLDLVAALEWVRENAPAFGGDPGNVTIFGESAGGTNVFTLLLSPKAAGLFHRAIVQSGGLGFAETPLAENFADDAGGNGNSSNEMLARLLVRDGRVPDRAAAKAQIAAMSTIEIEGHLRGKSGSEILSAYPPIGENGMIDMPKVFRDGAVLPDADPLEVLARGDYNRVPVMLGTNRDENKLFMVGDPRRVRRLLWVFLRLRDEQWYNLSAEYLAKMWKATGADEPAARMRAVQGPSVFVYRFDWDEEPTILGADLSVILGAAHAFEIPFVFGHFDLGKAGNMIFTEKNERGREALSAQMMSYWAEFAHRGAPGKGRDGQLVEWTPWQNEDATSGKFIVFDTPGDGGVRMSADALTREGILAAVDADARLASQRDKCRVFRELAAWGRAITEEDYLEVSKSGCAQYPFDGYPWEG